MSASVSSSSTISDDPEPTAAFERYRDRTQDREEPTQTRTLRSKYQQRLRGRWGAIMAALREGIVELDAFGLQTEALVDPPQNFDFDREANQVDVFERWLERQTNREILQQFGQDNQFVARAYEAGVDDARTELRALGLGGQAEVGATALQLPVHREQLENLYARNFRALEGMTDATANEMRRVLSEGLAGGESPRTIATELADRVDNVGKHRANLIGRTEIMHSHNRARATEWQRAGVRKVTILLAADACPQCVALRAGAPYSVEEAPGLLPLHPNCRCALSIYTGAS